MSEEWIKFNDYVPPSGMDVLFYIIIPSKNNGRPIGRIVVGHITDGHEVYACSRMVVKIDHCRDDDDFIYASSPEVIKESIYNYIVAWSYLPGPPDLSEFCSKFKIDVFDDGSSNFKFVKVAEARDVGK